MNLRSLASKTAQGLRITLASITLFQFAIGAASAGDTKPEANFPRDKQTASPIKHVIVIIGENRSFDHVFATYVPKNGETVDNLLSKGIIKLDGDKNAVPGPEFDKAQQLAATDIGTFLLNPPKQEFPNNRLPSPLAGGPTGANGYFSGTTPCGVAGVDAVTCAQLSENGLPTLKYYDALASGGTGLTSKTPDTRLNEGSPFSIPAGPFQLTGPDFAYNAYAASPVHRFYQMWQQLNCGTEHATDANPSGCNEKLFSWVEVTEGAGANGVTQPPLCSSNADMTPCFTTNYLPSVPAAITTGEGSTALGFYNVQKGDAPYFKSIADTFAMSDNFHQSVDGGTGANHIMFGHGDMIFYTNTDGKAAEPPENQEVFTKSYMGGPNPDTGTVAQVEDPNPAPGTNNWYTEDGYGNSFNAGFPPPYMSEPVSGGGSYTDCADRTQPGVAEIADYLQSINIKANCEKGHYYLLNNYNPGYFGNGKDASKDQNPANTPFTIPPSAVPSIGDSLNANAISWKYYGDQWNNYVPDPYQLNYGTNGPNADEYCNICNPFQYDTSIMSHPEQVKKHIQDTEDLYGDIVTGTLPAVSVVKPSGYVDGHPASSKLNLFEGFAVNPQFQILGNGFANAGRNAMPSFITANGPTREVRFPFFFNENGSPNTNAPNGGVEDLFTVSGRADAGSCSIEQPPFRQAQETNNIIYRIPTPTFGAGLIENLDDATLMSNEAANANNPFGISGSFNRNGNDGTISRFGWKAQNKSLEIFSGEAYNVEMGISNELFTQDRPLPEEELRDGLPSNCMNLSGKGYPEDATNYEVTPGADPFSTYASIPSDTVQFAMFMRLLAPPTPSATVPGGAISIANGRALFSAIGCATCHTPTIGRTQPSIFTSALSNVPVNAFSDLEIHHMGSGLADNVSQGGAGGDQFRTAPLWGLSQRIFLLHDGRTTNLVQAIEDHASNGSEATRVKQLYDALTNVQKQNLLNFLRSL